MELDSGSRLGKGSKVSRYPGIAKAQKPLKTDATDIKLTQSFHENNSILSVFSVHVDNWVCWKQHGIKLVSIIQQAVQW